MDISEIVQNDLVKIVDKCVTSEPMVSICVQTYNHGDYIDQCLSSIYAQQVNFAVEILIGDDSSSDGTSAICLEYQRKYPDITRLFIHDRNDNIYIDGRPSDRLNVLYNLQHARGKYLAFCEGDDYWIDDNKIQKQVEHLELHEDHLMCAHNVNIVEEHVSPVIELNREPGTVSFAELAQENFIYTCSIMMRNDESLISSIPTYFHDYLLDYFLTLLYGSRGEIYFMEDIMSTYRRGVGSFSTRSSKDKSILSFGTYLLLLKEITDSTYNEILRSSYLEHIKWHVKHDIDFIEEIQTLQDRIHRERLIRQREKDHSKIEELQFTLNKNEQYRSSLNSLFQSQILSAETRTTEIERSLSYRVGRMITFPARVLYDLIYAPQERLRVPAAILGTLIRSPKVFFKNISPKKIVVFFKALTTEDSDLIARNIETVGSDTPRPVLPPEDIKVNWPSHNDLSKGRDRIDSTTQDGQVDLPELDISIVTYNSARWIDGFVKSLDKLNYPLDKINLIFSDNGSADETQSKISGYIDNSGAKYRKASLLINENIGFGRAHNRAFEHADSDYFLVTNVDLEFEEISLQRLFEQVDKGDKSVFSWELRQKPFEHPKYYDPVTLKTAWSSHACILFRSSLFKQLNGYDKNIFMYGEDVELSYRARQQGYILMYVPQASVWHYTYEEHQFKPLQFLKSTLANGYLRLRYGSWADISRIISMQLSIRNVASQNGINRSEIYRNIRKIALKAPRYLIKRKKYDPRLSFYDWDYEKIREGAFYEISKRQESTPLVSIITRTYKGREHYLNQNLRNVKNQTYPHIEHIIVEDGGDSMLELIESHSRQDTSQRLFHYGFEKRGRSYTGNQGLRLAKGKYLMFLDDDDLLFSDHVEVLLNAVLNSDKNTKAAYSLSWEVLTEVTPDKKYKEREIRLPHVFRTEFDRDQLSKSNFIPIQSILFSRDLYEDYGGFSQRLDNLEDWNLWVRYSRQYDFKYVPKVTSMFRTPYDDEIRRKRQAELDSWYNIAVSENEMAH